MDFGKHISNIFQNEEENTLKYSNFSTQVSALYLFYHYFNADVSKIPDVLESLTYTLNDDSFLIKSIIRSNNIDDGIDFNSFIDKDTFDNLTKDELCQKVKEIAKSIGYVIFHDEKKISQLLISKFDDLGVRIKENTTFVIRIIAPFEINIEEKITIQEAISELRVSNENIIFDIIFGDDLEEEVNDVESPKEYVPQGTLVFKNNSICCFDGQGSFIALISAKSLKKLFLQYSTRGLFASNLRFYITNKKIDGKILNTIQNEPQNFCYFNNGIIITCDDYNINDGTITFKNFSIVNGGQTTNIVGRAFFENDFGIICKVIKNRFTDKNEGVTFLSKVAEASNMQKPINAKDLIANRIEQRLLKIQFAENGMFLKIKRGEKIDKTTYPEPYMNGSNDELAQLLYSIVFQAPGSSKNSKSTIISNEKTYNLIFKNDYNSNFLKSIQILKVAFFDWQKKLNKLEPHSSLKYGLSRHANFLTFAIIGFFLKFTVNENVRNYVLGLKFNDVNSKNTDFRGILKLNDIGKTSFLKLSTIENFTKSTFFDLFNYIFDNVLIPSYEHFKRDFVNYAYSQFSKSDTYYYDYVLILAKNLLISPLKSKELFSFLNDFNLEAESNENIQLNSNEISSESLEEEIKNYRAKIVEVSGKSLKTFQVLKTMQIAYIVKYYPTTYDALSSKCYLSDEQISLYGDEIIKIVKKYIKIEDFQ